MWKTQTWFLLVRSAPVSVPIRLSQELIDNAAYRGGASTTKNKTSRLHCIRRSLQNSGLSKLVAEISYRIHEMQHINIINVAGKDGFFSVYNCVRTPIHLWTIWNKCHKIFDTFNELKLSYYCSNILIKAFVGILHWKNIWGGQMIIEKPQLSLCPVKLSFLWHGVFWQDGWGQVWNFLVLKTKQPIPLVELQHLLNSLIFYVYFYGCYICSNFITRRLFLLTAIDRFKGNSIFINYY